IKKTGETGRNGAWPGLRSDGNRKLPTLKPGMQDKKAHDERSGVLSSSGLIARDLKHVWHPCSQMKDYETFPPVEIVGAKGSRLSLRDGSTLIDATSSWWCKTLGHGHPRLRAALERQAGRFEHIIG